MPLTQQSLELCRMGAERFNALVYSVPVGTRGSLLHQPALNEPFTGETAVSGQVEVFAETASRFRLHLHTDPKKIRTQELSELIPELTKLLHGTVIDAGVESGCVIIDYDSTPKLEEHLQWAQYAKKLIGVILEKDGPIGTRFLSEDKGITTGQGNRVNVMVMRQMGETSFAVRIDPYRKPRSTHAVTAALKFLMPESTITHVPDFTGQLALATVTLP